MSLLVPSTNSLILRLQAKIRRLETDVAQMDRQLGIFIWVHSIVAEL